MNATYAHRIRRSLRGCRFKLSLNLDLFEEGYCLDLFGFLIALPFMDRWVRTPRDMMEKWGVYYFERSIWFCWGDKHKSFYMPWSYEHIKCEVMRPDGSWVPYVASYETGPLRVVNDKGMTFGGKEPDGRWQETYPYHYVLKPRWEVQRVNATVYVERREWRQKWTRWCPFFARKSQSISVQFSEEVGEQSGSWKGGCVGCGYDMKPNETPLETLRRMERERVF